MKKILLPVAALAFFMASCTSTNSDNTTVNTTDTMMVTPVPATGMETPATNANGMTPPDNTNGGISTGTSDASMRGTGSGNSAAAPNGTTGEPMPEAGGSRSNLNPAGSDVANPAPGNPAAPTRSDVNDPKSTYPRAQPNAPVDGRMPQGTSR
ncbi:MAG: hypothetical protein EOP52_12005 [Sphingobacteriales bacterium]|nr:MAG: hypothetical protein EOP52_12005 [Sphingobacteriales bacterium]